MHGKMGWVERQLADLTYKDWSFAATEDYDGYGPALVVGFKAEDAKSPGTYVQAEQPVLLADIPAGDAEFFGRWLLALVQLCEMHEAEELLGWRGGQFSDPHRLERRVWSMALFEGLMVAARERAPELLVRAFTWADRADLSQYHHRKYCTGHLLHAPNPRP